MYMQYGQALWFGGQEEEGLSYISQAIQNRRKNRPGTHYLAQMLESQALALASMGENEKAQDSLNRELTQFAREVGFAPGDYSVAAHIIISTLNALANPKAALAFIESGFWPSFIQLAYCRGLF